MYTEITGKTTAAGLSITVVVARFNAFVTDRLLEGALGALKEAGAAEDRLTVIRVPGAWELPIAVKGAIRGTPRPDAVVALGCVIRGGTPHFEYVCSESTRGCQEASLEAGVPVGLGILTCDNAEQAIERAGGKGENKGENKGVDAAMAAVEMANLLRAMAVA